MNLSDGVVTLSPLRLADVDAHLAGEDELLVRWLNAGPGTRVGTEAYFLRCIEQWTTGGPLRAFAIRTGTPTILVGTIDVRFDQPDSAPGQVNIAYGLYPAWRGRGLATRAVHLACRYAGAEGATQAVIKVDPDNLASAAVARRSGFTFDTQVQESDGNRLNRHLRDLPTGTTAARKMRSLGEAAGRRET